MDMSDEETPGKTASAKKRKKLDSDQLRVSQSFRIFQVTLTIMIKTLKIRREKMFRVVSRNEKTFRFVVSHLFSLKFVTSL